MWQKVRQSGSERIGRVEMLKIMQKQILKIILRKWRKKKEMILMKWREKNKRILRKRREKRRIGLIQEQLPE